MVAGTTPTPRLVTPANTEPMLAVVRAISPEQSGIGSARTTGSGTTTGSGRRLRRLMAARAIAKVMTARVTPVEAISVSVSVLWLR